MNLIKTIARIVAGIAIPVAYPDEFRGAGSPELALLILPSKSALEPEQCHVETGSRTEPIFLQLRGSK